MARKDPQVNFRIPASLRDRLAAASVANGRTLTAEIVHRLEQSFSGEGRQPDAPPAAAPVTPDMIRKAAEEAAKSTLDYLDIPAFLRRQGIDLEPEPTGKLAVQKLPRGVRRVVGKNTR